MECESIPVMNYNRGYNLSRTKRYTESDVILFNNHSISNLLYSYSVIVCYVIFTIHYKMR